MQKFNLNDEILVQITDYGWEQLYKQESDTNNVGYVEHCIKAHEEIIDGEKWYRLQAHRVITDFGNMIFATFPSPLKPQILIP